MKIPADTNSEAKGPAAKEAVLRLHLEEFDILFTTDKDCSEVLCKTSYADEDVHCKNCGSLDLDREYGSRVAKCRSCKKDTWLTADTFFNRIRLARPWLFAIWLMEKGVCFNASQLHRLVKIAYSSAWAITKKITTVIQSYMEREPLAIAIPSALFAGAICKRSLATPANQHPIAEQTEIEKRLLESSAVSASDTNMGVSTVSLLASTDNALMLPLSSTGATTSAMDLCGLEKDVYENLTTEPIHFDNLCEQLGLTAGPLSSTLTMLVLDGLVENISGDRYLRATPPTAVPNQGMYGQTANAKDATNASLATIDAILDFVREGYHGISRKYLQCYLAAHWCHVDRLSWSPGSLLKACSRFRKIKHEEIRAFVSPLFVKVMPC